MAKRRSNSAALQALLRKDHHCHYCGLTVDTTQTTPHPRSATVDHKQPMSRGGAARGRANIVLACYLCNHKKGDMTEVEFGAYRRHLMLGKTKREALQIIRVEMRYSGGGEPDEGRGDSE